MSRRIKTLRSRVEFVEKATGDVGAGTGWVEVTADQLAEIMYRVKDAWFTSGALSASDGTTISVIGSLATSDKFALYDDDCTLERSYCLLSTSTFDHAAHYFGAGYDNPIFTAETHAYDIANDEIGILAPDEVMTPVTGINTPSEFFETYNFQVVWGDYAYSEVTFRCGFHHIVAQDMRGTPPRYGIYAHPTGYPETVDPTITSLLFSGRVAWVDDDLSGNPFSGGNRLFVGMYFYLSPSASGINLSNRYAPGDNIAAGVNLVLQLADSTVSCPLYQYATGLTTSGSDFVITAKEWWPYATSAGLPAWDTSTGLPVNDGPGA